MKTVVPVKTKELLKLNGFISGVVAGHMLIGAIQEAVQGCNVKTGAAMDFADARAVSTYKENMKVYSKLLKCLRTQCKHKKLGTGKATKYYYLQNDVEKFIEDWKKVCEANG